MANVTNNAADNAAKHTFDYWKDGIDEEVKVVRTSAIATQFSEGNKQIAINTAEKFVAINADGDFVETNTLILAFSSMLSSKVFMMKTINTLSLAFVLFLTLISETNACALSLSVQQSKCVVKRMLLVKLATKDMRTHRIASLLVSSVFVLVTLANA